MVSFKRFAVGLMAAGTLVPGLAAAPLESRATTAQQIVTFLEKLSTLSRNIETYARKVTAANGPLVLTGEGPLASVARGLDDSGKNITTQLRQMSGTSPFGAGRETDAVLSAYKQFANTHEMLINILIGKAGLLSTVPAVGTPVTAALRSDENALDSLAFGLADVAPSAVSAIRDTSSTLNQKLVDAEQAYGGIQLGPGSQ